MLLAVKEIAHQALPCMARLVFGSLLIVLVSACTNLAITAGFTSSASMASSATSSTAISSPFKSSTNSSADPPKQHERETEEEVKIYTASYIKAGSGSTESFMLGITRIAARRGISDWESHPAIWRGVGQGLGMAQLEKHQVADCFQIWSGGDENRIALQQQGYLSYKQSLNLINRDMPPSLGWSKSRQKATYPAHRSLHVQCMSDLVFFYAAQAHATPTVQGQKTIDGIEVL